MVLRFPYGAKLLKADYLAVPKGLHIENLQWIAFILETDQLFKTSMDIMELLSLPKDKKVTDASQTLYQQKVGSLLFAAIASRLNIAFAVSWLSQFNQQLGKQHHKAAD